MFYLFIFGLLIAGKTMEIVWDIDEKKKAAQTRLTKEKKQ